MEHHLNHLVPTSEPSWWNNVQLFGFSLPLTTILLSIILCLYLLNQRPFLFGIGTKWNGLNDSKSKPSLKPLNPVYSLPAAPSPLALPIIGHIYMLAKYPTNPWQGFNAIRQQYGDVVRLQLGKFRTVMVSSTEAIREVLLIKGDIFCDRPHFDRHALIFGRNRQNALALCDWSDIHKARRSIAHAAVIPRFGTKTFHRLSECIQASVDKMLHNVQCNTINNSAVLVKDQLLRMSCAIFVEFLLERNVNFDDARFGEICYRYDFIFYDINQMYLSDFVPFLKPITSSKYLNHVENNASTLMTYIHDMVCDRLQEVSQQRQARQKELAVKNVQQAKSEMTTKYDEKSCEERFVDHILLHKQYQSSAQFLDFILNHYLENQHHMTWDECLFEIGDLVGGNSAVANLLTRLLGHLALNADVQQQLYEEAMNVVNDKATANGGESHQNRTMMIGEGKCAITLDDQPYMPLTNASIMETLRLASSPIVPHLARQDTSIQGYFVPKNTMVLFNIYHMNLSSKHWKEPMKFNPARFVNADGNVVKPDFFFPFSHGRRSCLGYKMVNTIIFATVANLLLHYRLVPGNSANHAKLADLLEPRGTIALPYDGSCFDFHLITRDH